jgi:hypothetical protein
MRVRPTRSLSVTVIVTLIRFRFLTSRNARFVSGI